MSRSRRVAERIYLASAIGALVASCSIPEHEPVLAETGGAGSAQGGGPQGGSGGKSAGSGGAGTSGGSSSGGAQSKGSGGSGAVVTEGGAGGTPDGGAATGGDGGAAGSTDTGGAGGTGTGGATSSGGSSSGGATSTGGASGSGGATSKGGSNGSGGTGGTSATGGAGGKSSTGGAGGKSSTGGAAGTGGTGGKSGCVSGDAGPEGPSCTGLAARCGPNADSCCSSLCVPGGSFTMGGTVEAQTSQATISSYYLDKYEVTVGRFRKFVGNYDTWRGAGNPKQDAAKHPLIASSGWQAAWTNSLPASSAALLTSVTSACDAKYASWSSGNTNDPLPMNCVDWYQAFAFCAWDGGRLPTETEWEYAAAGGDDQRTYPWGPQVPSTARANYGCLDGPSGCSALSALTAAGSKPSGAGRWGHNDLAGSVYEWVLDFYRTPYPATRKDDALVTGDPIQLFLRVFRSSNFGDEASALPVAIRQNEEPTAHGAYFGLRCARLSSP